VVAATEGVANMTGAIGDYGLGLLDRLRAFRIDDDKTARAFA
jgi:hypothetical protein